jgi:hypothetical protein
MRFRSIVIFLLALVVAASALCLRRRPRPEVEVSEQEVGIVLSPTTEPAPSPSPTAAPALSEVQPTLDRVFDRTMIVDPATPRAFVAGDFNGDDVTDLAVAVRPRSPDALPSLNAELTTWSVQDAGAPTTLTLSRPEPVKVAAGDLLLAVVHGIDPGGWRNPEARQCYLVKNAVGSGMRRRPLAGVPAAIRMRANRTHAGDVIVGRRGGEPGLIFWTGAAYVWAEVKTGGAAENR